MTRRAKGALQATESISCCFHFSQSAQGHGTHIRSLRDRLNKAAGTPCSAWVNLAELKWVATLAESFARDHKTLPDMLKSAGGWQAIAPGRSVIDQCKDCRDVSSWHLQPCTIDMEKLSWGCIPPSYRCTELSEFCPIPFSECKCRIDGVDAHTKFFHLI